MKIKHTKGELEAVFENKHSSGEIYSIDKKGNREYICQTSGNAHNNAKRIVKCWNMHDELLEVVFMTVKILEEIYDMEVATIDKKAFDIIKKVIKKAMK